MKVHKISAITLVINDMNRSCKFYSRFQVLSLPTVDPLAIFLLAMKLEIPLII